MRLLVVRVKARQSLLPVEGRGGFPRPLLGLHIPREVGGGASPVQSLGTDYSVSLWNLPAASASSVYSLFLREAVKDSRRPRTVKLEGFCAASSEAL